MSRLRQARETAGLTQEELALRAGVSRQLIGAAESGRNTPRVDAAIAIADALSGSVEEIFGAETAAVPVITAEGLGEGMLVRSGRVGDVTVATPLASSTGDSADGIVVDGQVEPLAPLPAGFVVAGCEPGLVVVERQLRNKGAGALTVMASSSAALSALERGVVHAALVHGPALERAGEFADHVRIRLASWEVGLADAPDALSGWFESALRGELPVVQREPGAGVQQAFEAAVLTGATVRGPQAGSHIEAASHAVHASIPAVTIAPAALAVGAQFRPLGFHETQLWINPEYADVAAVRDALDFLSSRAYRLWLQSTGGYVLDDFGTRVA